MGKVPTKYDQLRKQQRDKQKIERDRKIIEDTLHLVDKKNIKTLAQLHEGEREIRKQIRIENLLYSQFGAIDNAVSDLDGIINTHNQTRQTLKSQAKQRKKLMQGRKMRQNPRLAFAPA